MLERVDGYLYGEENCIVCKKKMFWYCKVEKSMPDVENRIKAKFMPTHISNDSPEVGAQIFFECPDCEAITKLEVQF